MPKRLNDFTVQFHPGEKPIPELAWWTASYFRDVNQPELFLSVRQPVDGTFTTRAYNFWLRRGPFNVKDGRVVLACTVNAPKDVIDRYLEPERNEWGDVCP